MSPNLFTLWFVIHFWGGLSLRPYIVYIKINKDNNLIVVDNGERNDNNSHYCK
ncbi:hypothetical protein MED121_03417 [Marinomonas sp. MED121]|nr:hypothetical protein MED121_03417 [Marinomonas sp. MED121]